MKKVLCINAHPYSNLETSVSNQLMDYTKSLLNKNDNLEIGILDLDKTDVYPVSEDMFSTWGKQGTPEDFSSLEEKINESQESLIGKMKEYDTYIISYPIHNFMIPSKLKDFFDNVLIAGKTFKYTSQGPVGLLDNKKVIIIQASGSRYTEDPMYMELDFGPKYTKSVFSFMGVGTILLRALVVHHFSY